MLAALERLAPSIERGLAIMFSSQGNNFSGKPLQLQPHYPANGMTNVLRYLGLAAPQSTGSKELRAVPG